MEGCRQHRKSFLSTIMIFFFFSSDVKAPLVAVLEAGGRLGSETAVPRRVRSEGLSCLRILPPFWPTFKISLALGRNKP